MSVQGAGAGNLQQQEPRGPVSDKLIRTIHCYRIVGSLGFLQPETLPSKNKSVVKFRKELHDEWLLYFVCSEFAAEQSVYFNSK